MAAQLKFFSIQSYSCPQGTGQVTSLPLSRRAPVRNKSIDVPNRSSKDDLVLWLSAASADLRTDSFQKKKDQTQTECYFELLNYSQRFLFGQHRAEHESKLILFVFQELCFIIYQLLNERDMTTQRGVHKNNEETKAISQQSVIGNGYYSHKNLNIKTRYWPQKNMHSIRSQSAYEQTVIKLKTEMSIF